MLLVEKLLSPRFPDLALRARSATSIKTTQPETSGGGSGRAGVVDDEEPKDTAQKPGALARVPRFTATPLTPAPQPSRFNLGGP